MKSTFSRPILKLLFMAYVMGLLYLLFVYDRSLDLSWIVKGGYPRLLDVMRYRYNLIPLNTILSKLAQMSMANGVETILKDIVGHVLAFSWLGYFMPRLWPKYKQKFTFVWTVGFILILVEIVQFFTMSGMMDIDDILLNLSGAYLGLIFLRKPEALSEEIHD